MVNINKKSVLCLIPLLGTSFVSGGWIDPDTPQDKYIARPYGVPDRFRQPYQPPDNSKNVSITPSSSPSKQPTSSVTYDLIMSDEFNAAGRTFEDGSDPKWTAINKNDYTNGGLHYYSNKNAKVNDDGELVISTTDEDTEILGYNDKKGEKEVVTKHFRSAMMQTWNKFCFTGGIIEAEIQLPGRHNIGGLWPAFWMLGNLARHTYVDSSTHIWPFSSNVCNTNTKLGQKFNACNMFNHYGFKNHHGRGASEIDIFEIQAGPTERYHGPFLESNVGQPFMSNSFQVAPGRSDNRPATGKWPGPGQWYDGLTGGEETNINILFYGDYNHNSNDPKGEDPGTSPRDYWSDAISYNRQLYETHFNSTHKYRLEWELPDETTGFSGYLRWYLDDKFVFEVDGEGLKEAGEGAEISTEPSYIILNTAISSTWGFPSKCPEGCPCEKYDCKSKSFSKKCGFSSGFCDMLLKDKIEYKVNSIRVYQNKNDPKQTIGCSTPGRPTSQFIKGHPDLYKDESDEKPLKDIQQGGGACSPEATGTSLEACGGPTKGICTSNVCECKEEFTGPHCLAHNGFNDINYDEEKPLEVIAPSFEHSKVLWFGLGVLVISVVLSILMRNNLDGYQPIQ